MSDAEQAWTASLASALVGPFERVAGIDLTPEMVLRANHYLGATGAPMRPCRWLQRSPLWFPDESFDVVTSNGALNLVPEKLAVFREVHRVLRRGGGRFQVADVVRVRAPRDQHGDPDAWSR